MSEAHKCFTYLRDNAPKWVSELSSLEKHVEEKQKELAQGDGGEGEAVARPDRIGSIPSIRKQDVTNGHHTIQNDTDASGGSPEDSAHPSASRRRNVLIKRNKTSSVLTSNMSAPPKFRSRSMIIVYYDAEIQKAFEKLVREIGNGRHLIRKAKMAAQAEAISGSLTDDDLYEMADDAVAPSTKVLSFRRAGSSNSQSKTPRGKLSPMFETTDKALERGQSLCERAAHQFLRDGDCRLETKFAKEAFEEVLKASSEELARLETSEKTSGASECVSEENVGSADPFADKPCREEAAPQSSRPSGFTSIEVDDEEELMPTKMSTLRLTSRMGPRRGRG